MILGEDHGSRMIHDSIFISIYYEPACSDRESTEKEWEYNVIDREIVTNAEIP